MQPVDTGSPLFILLTNLYTQYHKHLVNYANYFVKDKEVAEDIVHECYAKILTLKNKDKFVKMEIEKTKAFICRMIKNSCLNYLRKKQRGLDAELVKTGMFHELTPEEKDNITIRQRVLGEFYKLLPSLTEQDKEILYLHYIKELTAREIAEILKIPAYTVEYRLKVIREMFKKISKK